MKNVALISTVITLASITTALAQLSAGTSIRVTISDAKIALSKRSAPVGRVTFVIQNHGKLVHNFRVGGKTSKPISPGHKASLVVVFRAAKSWAFLSTLPHGKTKGLNGVLKVVKPAPATSGNARAGAAVFSTAGCGSCHTLKAASAIGQVGPSLDATKPLYGLVVDRVTNGKGSMPPFKSTLTVTQIENVAAYVYASTHQ